ncbi:hypothetical protein [Actinoplanes solisilvae]|uniref:hypothetical protein n=1 Tax=Actinoplanes solisilvae TaxID=2486853 RepID=UPI000FDC48EB|nr:hypothetical protein [Actinoplanes solisilvae]
MWRENRDLILHGRLTPERPDLLYPVARVEADGRHLIARYAPQPIVVPTGDWTEVLIANADDSPTVLLAEAAREVELEVRDARGRLLVDTTVWLPAGPQLVSIPAGGLARLKENTR